MGLLLTEPSQVIEAGPGEGEQQPLAHLRKPPRGQVCFDLSCVLIAGSHVSAKRIRVKIRTPGLWQVSISLVEPALPVIEAAWRMFGDRMQL